MPSVEDDYVGTEPGDDEAEENPSFCTYAVTGNQSEFQAIFVCNECLPPEDDVTKNTGNANDAVDLTKTQTMPLCICQACADVCHDGDFHEVDYIGMGPATCDCHSSGHCKIYEQSLKEAERLGMTRRRLADDEREHEREDDYDSKPEPLSPSSMVKEVYEISSLCDITITTLLIDQANELVRHTKETHWLDMAVMESETDLSQLEHLAWRIYQHHLEAHSDVLGTDSAVGGAEWWVQVKPLDDPSSSTCGIDLHYDKDEALAESFGLGSFPTLSTVTYLTSASQHAPPTIVMDHTYFQGEDEVMSHLLVSRPRPGKHLVFDGRLLHGAPYHPSLQHSGTPHQKGGIEGKAKFRVTFLVNLWKDQRPANVEVLPKEIRQAILLKQPTLQSFFRDPLQMDKMEIPLAQVEEEKDLPEFLQERIELPFVSDKGATGAIDESGLVVVTFLPPPFEDSILVAFGPGMQAYFEYTHDDEGEKVSTSQFVKDQLEFEPPNKQSDYV